MLDIPIGPGAGWGRIGIPTSGRRAWDENQDLAIGLFVPKVILTEVIGPAYERTLVNPIVFRKDRQGEAGRLDSGEVRPTLGPGRRRGHNRNCGRDREFGNGTRPDRERWAAGVFSRIPLLFLLTIMVVTVLFYMTMMVSYLAKSRERDSSLMRTRGVGLAELLRLYTVEGIVMCLLAFILGPLIAFGAIAVIGLVPPSGDDGAELLLVRAEPLAFAIGVGVALLCLFLYVAFGAAGARERSARSEGAGGTTGDDVVLSPVLPRRWPGGHRRTGLLGTPEQGTDRIQRPVHRASGKRDAAVRPILFLIVVALFFMRLFPLFVRYIGGESPGLVHLLTGLSVAGLAGAPYSSVTRTGHFPSVFAGDHRACGGSGVLRDAPFHQGSEEVGRRGAQGVAVAAYVFAGDIQPSNTLFIAEIGLLAIVPAQALYSLLAQITRARAGVAVDQPVAHGAQPPTVHVAGAGCSCS